MCQIDGYNNTNGVLSVTDMPSKMSAWSNKRMADLRPFYIDLKELLGKRIFLNFVNFEKLIYMKVYSLLILNKKQKRKKQTK